MKCFVVKDMKAQCYLQPMFQRSVADALRSWEVVANEGESMIRKFPNDYRLFHLADFDMQTGEVSVFAIPVDLGSAADFLRAAEPTPMFPGVPSISEGAKRNAELNKMVDAVVRPHN